jgi:L-malate glycosyltransferase
MRILQITSALGINGVSKHIIDVATELRKRGHEIHLVGYPDAWIVKEARKLGFPAIESTMKRWPTIELHRISAYIREQQIDVTHTHMSKAHFFGVLLKWFAGVPSVATAHSCLLQLHWMANDFVIAVSDDTRQYQRRVNWVSRKRIKTIHNSIHMPQAMDDQERANLRTLVRSRMGLEPSDFAVGLVGRVSPQKGHLSMIDAMPSILHSLPKAKLVLIGGLDSAEYATQVKKKVEDFGIGNSIRWLGIREDVRELLYGIDVLAQPSLWECFPISMLEGMAAEVPIVATDVGGVRECLEHNRSGCLIAREKPLELSQQIVRLATSPALCRRLTDEAKKIVQFRFTPESQTPQIEQVLASVCKSNRKQQAA